MSTTPPPPPPTQEPPTEQLPPQQPPVRRFLRSRDDRVLGGVCGGLGRYFSIDPTIVRVAAVALAFVGGVSIIAYLAAWLLVPEDDGTGHPAPGGPSRAATIAGAVLVVVAGVTILDGSWHWGWNPWLGPLVPTAILVGVLGFIGYRLLERRNEAAPTAGRIAAAGLLVLAALAGLTIAALGAAWATAAGGGVAVAGLVIALGVTMLVQGARGRNAAWLVVPALAIAIPAGVVAAAGVDVHGGVGQRTYRPATVADVKAGGYRLGIGETVVDLRTMAWPSTGVVDLSLDQGVGHALVLVPGDVCVQADAKVGAGYVNVLGDDAAGVDVDYSAGTARPYRGPKLVLHADLGMGAVQVLHRRHERDFGHGAAGAITRAQADAGCAGAVA